MEAWDRVAHAAAAGAVECERYVFQTIPPVYPNHGLGLASHLGYYNDSDLWACRPDLPDYPEQ